jgi:formylglycine-generating enzyme required for sulfatase activity
MKKILTLLFIFITFLIIFSCKKNSPTSPAVSYDYSELVSVPGGTFTQTDGTNSFSHTISSFKIGKYQVTYDLWQSVYQWANANGYTFQNAGSYVLNNKYTPVTMVNWRDVIVWCNAYSQKTGLTPVYYSDETFTMPIKDSTDGAYGSTICTTAGCYDDPYVKWGANGYRLPTEGEYQYAACYIDGSNWTPYNYASGAAADYTDAIATGMVAWYSANCNIAQTVGTKNANSLGIYDMSGNVWEWCWDWEDAYPTGSNTNYKGYSSGISRVTRGGSSFDNASSMQVGGRGVCNPYTSNAVDVGFRFARTY